MSFVIKNENNSQFEPAPTGMHIARCYRIIDLGTQKTMYQGKERRQHKIMIQWEIHSEKEDGSPTIADDGKPMNISKRYTVSLSEKARLRIDLKSWRGRDFTNDELNGFELKNILGAWCYLNIARIINESDNQEYTNIQSVNPVPAAIKKAGLPIGVNDLVLYKIGNDDSQAIFDTFSENMKKNIMASPEWQDIYGGKQSSSPPAYHTNLPSDLSYDIPF